jgi:hypothetical protein
MAQQTWTNYKCTECFFYEPLSNGFVFNFYSIKSKKIIENIMQIGVDKYYENNKFIYIKFNSNISSRDLCINRNNHQKSTFHPLGDFLNPALALLGQGLKKSPIG